MAVCNPYWQTSEWTMYRYVPSVAAAVIFCLLFCASCIGHAWQMWRVRAWFLTCLVLGCLAEFIGYASRAASASEKPGCWGMMPFIIQSVFILIGPALFSASIYMILGRIVVLVGGESHIMIKPRRLTKTFVTGDIICMLMQAGSGGLSAGGREIPILADVGKAVIITSLFLQAAWFFFFLVVAVVFHRRLQRDPTPQAARYHSSSVPWQAWLRTLYVAGGLVMVRSLFRAAEFIGGDDNAVAGAEWFLYVFDALPMFLVVAMLHWRHPGEISVLMRRRFQGGGDDGVERGSQHFILAAGKP